jgi:hypothetical protein
MKKLWIVLLVLVPRAARPDSQAQAVDWQAVEKIPHFAQILVQTQQSNYCYFVKATPDNLYCLSSKKGFPYTPQKGPEVVFRRDEIRAVRIERFDWSKGIPLLAGAGSGGGWDSSRQPAVFAGIKIGGMACPCSLDLQYDRVQGHNGFSTEGSAVLPLFRFPRFKESVLPGSQKNEDNARFLRVYAEPGIGYRAGGRPFGQYTSAKVLFLLFPDDKAQPYLEFQRRFPFNSPLQGDNRLTVGLMLTLCAHCGLN